MLQARLDQEFRSDYPELDTWLTGQNAGPKNKISHLAEKHQPNV
jgi:hypothetical protein